jgi:hypothetical protein
VTDTWDSQLVQDIFWEEDVANILSIPIRSGCEDTVAWHFDPKGVFSVKYAHHVLKDSQELSSRFQRSESSSANDGNNDDKVWRKIWKLPWPPKLKQCMWRVGHNSLAMKLNIRRRGIKLDTRCPVCWRLDEDGGHCFLECKYVCACWRGLQLEDVRQQLLEAQSAIEFVKSMLDLETDICLKVATLLWEMWDVRNKMNAGERLVSSQEMCGAVLCMVMEIQDRNVKEVQQQTHAGI